MLFATRFATHSRPWQERCLEERKEDKAHAHVSPGTSVKQKSGPWAMKIELDSRTGGDRGEGPNLLTKSRDML